MAGVIDLTRDRGPSVQESTANINRVLDLAGEREELRQKRQQINDFVSETIKLQGENPTMSPDLVSRQAALNISQKDPTFDPGIAGLFQKFAAGARPPDTTTLTGPIAEGLLSEPTGIRRDLIKAQIESTRALTAARTGATGPAKPTAAQKQRDSDIAVLNRKAATPTQRNEAKSRLLASGQLAEPNASKAEIDSDFSDIMDELKELSVVQKGDVLDRRFGKKAFDAGLKQATENAFKQGANPESVKTLFETWWDEQFEAEKGQIFQKFQDRSEFQEVEETGDVDVSQLSDEALDRLIKAGK